MSSGRVEFVVARPCGQFYVNGLSNAYSLDESIADDIEDVLDRYTLRKVIREFNDAIRVQWPCGPSFYISIICTPCTLGLSLLLPRVAISKAENAGHQYLHEVNITKEFNDKQIEFTLVKLLGQCSSKIVVSFPASLLPQSQADVEALNEMSPINDITDQSVETSTSTRQRLNSGNNGFRPK